MKAQELRVGNHYIDICGAVNEWSNHSFEHYRYVRISLSKLKPILLTEEWLIKFGFENDINSSMVQFWTLGKFILYHENYIHTETTNREYFELSNYYDVVGSSQEIIYVHQLQNLYFALTGEELEIK